MAKIAVSGISRSRDRPPPPLARASLDKTRLEPGPVLCRMHRVQVRLTFGFQLITPLHPGLVSGGECPNNRVYCQLNAERHTPSLETNYVFILLRNTRGIGNEN